jgi:flagellar biosynthesis protein FlhG
VLVLTTPEPTAITDAYAVIKVITASAAIARDAPTGAAVSLLVNQARSPGEARVVHERIAKVARQFLGVSVLDAGYLYADEQVPIAVRKRTPFVLAPQVARGPCVTQLACGSSRA